MKPKKQLLNTILSLGILAAAYTNPVRADEYTTIKKTGPDAYTINKKGNPAPKIIHFGLSKRLYEKKPFLEVEAIDRGRNKGIDKLILYEDDNPISTYKVKRGSSGFCVHSFSITPKNSGTHKYKVRVFDISGNTASSKEIRITYKTKSRKMIALSNIVLRFDSKRS